MTMASPNGSSEPAPSGPQRATPTDLRRLSLDVQDLRFENDRLRAQLAAARTEIETLGERNRILQHRFDRLLWLAPRGSLRFVRGIMQRFRRR